MILYMSYDNNTARTACQDPQMVVATEKRGFGDAVLYTL